LTTEESEFDNNQKKVFLFSTASTQLPMQCIPGALSAGIKLMGPKTLPNTEVMDM
jgi:hypothetical protein